MQSVDCLISTKITRTSRVLQLEGLFDIPPCEKSEVRLEARLPLSEQPWNIGLIHGPSGSGKTTLAKRLWPNEYERHLVWSENESILDAFPASMNIKQIVELLCHVGFSSPPSWLRPFHVLSTGEQFRVTMARILGEGATLNVVDEFTSVVDRTVAQIGSVAIAKTVRKRNQQLIAISCHADIVEWLQPDWTFEPAVNRFQWRRLRRHPEIRLYVHRVHPKIWDIFKSHHYLSADLHKAAQCYCAFLNDNRAVAFTAVLAFPHAIRPGYREHRTVCLPDFQGVGIGNRLSDFVASMYLARNRPYRSTTSHPGMIQSRRHSLNWVMIRKPDRTKRSQQSTCIGLNKSVARDRITASFEFVGQVNSTAARELGVIS